MNKNEHDKGVPSTIKRKQVNSLRWFGSLEFNLRCQIFTGTKDFIYKETETNTRKIRGYTEN